MDFVDVGDRCCKRLGRLVCLYQNKREYWREFVVNLDVCLSGPPHSQRFRLPFLTR